MAFAMVLWSPSQTYLRIYLGWKGTSRKQQDSKRKTSKHSNLIFWERKTEKEEREKKLSRTDLSKQVAYKSALTFPTHHFADTHGVDAYYLYKLMKYIYLH